MKNKKRKTITKFNVELEISVEYNIKEDINQTTPYTTLVGRCQEGDAILFTDKGKVIDIDLKKFRRI